MNGLLLKVFPVVSNDWNFSARRTVLKNKAIDSRWFAGTADNAHAASHRRCAAYICVYVCFSRPDSLFHLHEYIALSSSALARSSAFNFLLVNRPTSVMIHTYPRTHRGVVSYIYAYYICIHSVARIYIRVARWDTREFARIASRMQPVHYVRKRDRERCARAYSLVRIHMYMIMYI